VKVLFIGGTGIISSAASRLAVERGIELYHLNRGRTAELRRIDGVRSIIADIHNEAAAAAALDGHRFDAVVDWICFTEDDIRRDLRLFDGKCDQFVFISSASVYQTPPRSWPVTENTPAVNPVWKYSQNKIACENVLRNEARFPYTVVRPSHTYDRTLIPLEGGFTVLRRIREGRPIVIHGDGSSLWTLTNNRDFAVGLVGLLGNDKALGETVHITSDEYLSWDEIARQLADPLGTDPDIVHIPSEVIAEYHKDIGDSLLGDKAHSMIFDNSKIRSMVPEFSPAIRFREGAREIVEWYLGTWERHSPDADLDALFDRMIEDRRNR
jgi:nucleoside-diphosphate-sugar epimerase